MMGKQAIQENFDEPGIKDFDLVEDEFWNCAFKLKAGQPTNC